MRGLGLGPYLPNGRPAAAPSQARQFAVIATLTLALGIGSLTTIFSVVNAVVLSPLPYPDPGELVRLRTDMTDGRETTGAVSPLTISRIRESERVTGGRAADGGGASTDRVHLPLSAGRGILSVPLVR